MKSPILRSPASSRRLILSSSRATRCVLPVLAVCAFFLAPLHRAEAQTAQWEYRVVSAKLNNRLLEQMLNNQAAQGWELVQITDRSVAIFRKKK